MDAFDDVVILVHIGTERELSQRTIILHAVTLNYAN